MFYDLGVGTLARPDPWTKLKQDAIAVLGLATGYGLDDNILAAYEFLINQYEDGDEIYLFGFSQGAYTVRVLAGLVHRLGLLSPDQRNLAGAALTAYKQVGMGPEPLSSASTEVSDSIMDGNQPAPSTKDDRASQFARIVSA